MSNLLKLSIIALLITTTAVTIVFKFSSEKKYLRCQSEDETRQLDIIFEDYRFWVGLWSESEGNLWIEERDGYVHYFGQIEENQRELRVFDDQQQVGSVVKLSGRLNIRSSTLSFQGYCESNDNPAIR